MLKDNWREEKASFLFLFISFISPLNIRSQVQLYSASFSPELLYSPVGLLKQRGHVGCSVIVILHEGIVCVCAHVCILNSSFV